MENSINTTEKGAVQRLGDRIRKVREDSQMSQEAFAAVLSISQSHLANVERGCKPLSRIVSKVLGLEFFVNEDWLATGEGPQYNRAAVAAFQMDDAERSHRAQIAKGELVDEAAEPFEALDEQANTQELEEVDERPAIDVGEARKQAGPRIRQMREALSVTADELAGKFGITTGYLRLLEEGKAQASNTLLGLIIREYGLNYEWLSWGGGPMVHESRQKQTEAVLARQEPPAFVHFSDQVYDIELRSMEGMYDIPFDDGFDRVQQMLETLEGMGAPTRLTNRLSDEYSNGLANAQRTFYQYGVRDAVAFFLQALEFGSVPLFPREAAELLARRISQGLEAQAGPDAVNQQERGA